MKFISFMSTTKGRYIRIGGGLALIAIGGVKGRGWYALSMFGLAPLLTGALNYCPITALTRKRGETASSSVA